MVLKVSLYILRRITNITTGDRIERALGICSHTLCCASFTNSRHSVKEDDDAFPCKERITSAIQFRVM